MRRPEASIMSLRTICTGQTAMKGQFHRRNIDAAILFVIAGNPREVRVACILKIRVAGAAAALS